MGIFLMILKIIGITLAVLVGLILLIVMLVLFVPIRYKGNGQYPYTGNKLPADVHATISWLLHLVHVTFDTTSEGQIIRAKFFGFTIYTNDPEVVAKKAEKKKKKEEKRKAKEKKKREKEEKRLNKLNQAQNEEKKKLDDKHKKLMDEQKQKFVSEQDKEFKKWNKEQEKNKKSEANRNSEANENSEACNDSLGSLEDSYFDSDAVSHLNNENQTKAEDKKVDSNTHAKPGTKEYIKEHAGDKSKKKSEIYDKNVKILDDIENSDDDLANDETSNDEDVQPKVSFVEKLVEKIKGIVEIPKKIYNKILGIFEKITNVKEFAENNRVQAGFKYALKKVLLILKRILPRKISGHCNFGMSDPATTGYIYGGACTLYGVWAKSFEITPDFNEKRLEADARFKGRIIIISIIIPGLKILLNKDVKYLRYRLGKLKSSDSSDAE